MFTSRLSNKLPITGSSLSSSSMKASCNSSIVKLFGKNLTLSSPSTTISSTQIASASTVSNNVQSKPELVTFLGLNSLSDNPGAVKKVNNYHVLHHSCSFMRYIFMDSHASSTFVILKMKMAIIFKFSGTSCRSRHWFLEG